MLDGKAERDIIVLEEEKVGTLSIVLAVDGLKESTLQATNNSNVVNTITIRFMREPLNF
jgi:hypothetical protein